MQICCQANYSLTALHVTWLDLIHNIAVTPSPITSNSGYISTFWSVSAVVFNIRNGKPQLFLAMENRKKKKKTKHAHKTKNLADRDLLPSKIYFSSAKDSCFLENIHNQEKQAAQTQSPKLTWATGLHMHASIQIPAHSSLCKLAKTRTGYVY